MKVGEVMRRDVPTARREESATAAWDRMRAARADYMVVLTREGRIAGTLSAQDLSGPAGGGHRRMGRTVADLMRVEVATATPGTSVARAAVKMRKGRLGCVPIVERGKLVGMVTTHEMLGILARNER